MKSLLAVAAAAAAIAFSSPSGAQPRGAVAGESVEALVTVVAVNKKARTVVIRGPRGGTQEVQVPKDAQNFDRVKPGDVFRVRYTEAVAVAIDRGQPDKGDKTQRALAAKGANPGGVEVRTRYVSGRIEAIDAKNRYVAIRGPKQQTVALKVADDVNLDALHPGDRITIAYTQAVAVEMVPQPPKAKPAAKKK
jgi:type II secretory pathway pseudopilin PulG